LAEPGALRAQIIKAAHDVLLERGYAATTIRQIAKAAGVADGSVYNHFTDKVDLLSSVVQEGMSTPIKEAVGSLTKRIGTRDVVTNVTDLAVAMIPFFAELIPFVSSAFADTQVLRTLREGIETRGAGPARLHQGLENYLKEEQQLGRVDAKAPVAAIAAAVIGGCHEYSFMNLLHDQSSLPRKSGRYARDLARVALNGYLP
jgi:AcrR family transcriptional regulator